MVYHINNTLFLFLDQMIVLPDLMVHDWRSHSHQLDFSFAQTFGQHAL